jgi:hypothetical protein
VCGRISASVEDLYEGTLEMAEQASASDQDSAAPAKDDTRTDAVAGLPTVNQALTRYTSNLDGLREFVRFVAPVLRERTLKHLQASHGPLAPIWLGARLSFGEEISSEEMARAREIFGAEFSLENRTNADGTTRTHFVVPSPAASQQMSKAVLALGRYEKQRKLLYQDALINLLSATEWFVADLLQVCFAKYPESAGIEGKQLTFEELRGLGSLDEARKYLVDAKIESILRGSIESWIDDYKKIASIQDRARLPDSILHRLVEASQRRNLVVHSAGIVNSIYMSRVHESLRERLTIGQEYIVGRKYLFDTLNLFEQAFVLLGAAYWKKQDRGDTRRANFMNELTVKHVEAGRYQLAEALSDFSRCDAKEIPEAGFLSGQLNYWQCLKWQGRYDEIRREIESADFSAKDDIFCIARLVLLDDFAAALTLLRRALDSGKVDQDALNWPIFKELRKQGDFKRFWSERGLAIKEDNESQEDESSDDFPGTFSVGSPTATSAKAENG